MTGNQVLYETPVAQLVRARPVLLSGLALAFGVAGDLASCGRIPMLALWAPLLTGCHYVAIVLAAVGFGFPVGVLAAIAVGFVHVALGMIVCARSIPQQSEAAAFVVVGLLAGLLRYPANGANSKAAQLNLATRGTYGQEPLKVRCEPGGEVSTGFCQAARAPLDAIESAGYVLQEAGLTGENHREVAAIVLKECHRLDTLIRSLDFVQPLSPVYQEIRLSSLLDELVRLASDATKTASITLRRAEGPDPRLVCDPYLIEQAILDIVTNAIRIVGPGGEIVLSAHLDKGDAMIKISHRHGAHLEPHKDSDWPRRRKASSMGNCAYWRIPKFENREPNDRGEQPGQYREKSWNHSGGGR